MLIATSGRVFSFDEKSTVCEPILALEGPVKGLCAGEALDAVLLDGGEAVLLGDVPRRFDTGIDAPLEAVQILSEDPLELLVGTEGPHLYRVTADQPRPTAPLEGFEGLECRASWYTPWGGPAAVRTLAGQGDWLYADIHVGSIMRSPDLGTCWEPVTPDLHEDVHQVATCPAAPKRVYANTADAVFVSEDRGDSWTRRADGLPARYGRAIAVHPQDPDCLLASVSNGPHGDAAGKLYRSTNGGRTWSHVTEGFPATVAGNIDTYHLAFDAAGHAWAVVGPDLLRSKDGGIAWDKAWTAPQNITALSCTA